VLAMTPKWPREDLDVHLDATLDGDSHLLQTGSPELHETEPCQAQEYSNCADPAINHLRRCGILASQACKKDGECGLQIVITGRI
jgi:hypothetical protein